MSKPYPNCWGLQKSMVNLWDIVGDDLKKKKAIGRVYTNHIRDLDYLVSSDLPLDFKRRILTWIQYWYKTRIFEDIRCLDKKERGHLFSAIMGKQRAAHRELHK